MSHVHIAADNHWFATAQIVDVSAEIIIPLNTVVEAAQFVLRVWRVNGNEEEIAHFQRDYAPFMVVLVDAKPVGYAQRLVLGEDCSARIAFFVGIVPVGCVAGEGDVELAFLHLGFLQAEEVGIKRGEIVAKVLSYASAQSVDIPRDEFHICVVLINSRI